MAKRLVYLVTPLLFAACAPDLPRELYIDDRFNAEEEGHIVAMIDEMNRTGQELLGRDLVAYKGRHQDADGWDLDDADDGSNVIYKQMRSDANYEFIDSTADADGEDGFVLGLGLHHDIILYAFMMIFVRGSDEDMELCFPPSLHEWYEEDNGKLDDDGNVINVVVEDWGVTASDCGREGYSLYGPELEAVAIHEMGHFIGLAHIMDPEAMMYPISNGSTAFTDIDKRALCCVYECITDEYECVLPRQ